MRGVEEEHREGGKERRGERERERAEKGRERGGRQNGAVRFEAVLALLPAPTAKHQPRAAPPPPPEEEKRER